MTDRKVVTRFAPSPTGLFHVGSARTALFNWLYAKKTGGKFLLRIEDTDKERSKKEYEDNILDAMNWLGMEYDDAFIRQSERTSIYKRYIEQMINNGYAYISKEEPQEEGERSEVIRFKNPNEEVSFEDTVRGTIVVNTSDLGDFVIAKSLEEPVYHLAVVIDDHEMGITHVIRGEDHISNTPRQILIQQAIGANRPYYTHLPLILGSDKSKLSKRHGAAAVTEYRDKGYLSDALVNYLAFLGWNPGDDREVFTQNELIEAFDIGKIQKAGAVFNIEKLNWVNKQHILKLDQHTFMHEIEERIPADMKKLPMYSLSIIKRIVPVIRERIEKFEDITAMAEEGELEYYFERPEYFTEKLLWKDDSDPQTAFDHLKKIKELIEILSKEEFKSDIIKGSVWEYATKQGRGSVLWPFRYALSGMDRSPDPFTLAEILEKEETLARLDVALNKLEELVPTRN